MLNKQKDWSGAIKAIKVWLKSEQVVDVIIFGSSVRGKSTPRDIDLCIILHDHQEKKALDLIHSLSQKIDKKGVKFQINILTEKTFFSGENSLVKTLFQEGFSVIKNKPFATLYGLSSQSLLVYSLVGFSGSQRVRFHYLLRGRSGQPGILSKLHSELVNDGVISVPTEYEDEWREIFQQWGVQYQVRRMLLC